ncbi:MAG: TIGR02530 family flagellar biosynthesis protein [Melioribacteraceae bacterium]|jgi:flagellar operon protein|nr:flagellar protein [Melioribacteraceae bacterium]RJP63111.1 MAG: flagellar protein [Ignavibacteriales bacterium]WKZ70170.1 MAG: TIGR02530 family flagellar biosynthesis protein [Melioribacteraceae bacterium]
MPQINGVSVPFVPIIENNNFDRFNSSKEVSSKFNDLLNDELSKLKFSSHATKRLEDRNIVLSNEEMGKINEAVQRAEDKGSKDSLVMMNGNAFIVNIPNKTVITAMPLGSNDNVFTNIDSVVFA